MGVNSLLKIHQSNKKKIPTKGLQDVETCVVKVLKSLPQDVAVGFTT